jgi:Tfp pilus assembly protein PilF
MRGRRPGEPLGLARLAWLLGALVAVWTLVVFLPTVWNGFVNWDDPHYFLENPHHYQPWLERLRSAWTTHLVGEYMPVTIMTFSLDRSMWDLHAAGYHLTSVLLHVLAAVLVYWLGRHLLRHALGPEPPGGTSIDVGAAAAALLFAVHPLRVEPVAWLSARGTVLGGLLLVLTVLLYVVGWERGGRAERIPTSWLLASVAAFVASLLARAPGLMLTPVLVVLDVYPLRRLDPRPSEWTRPGARRVWAEKSPFAVISVLGVLMGFLARGEEAGDFTMTGWDPPVAIAWATYSTGFYVWKTIGIGTLSPMYAMPTRAAPMLLPVILSALTTLTITGILLAARRRWPGALAAWVAYLLLLGPISGIVPFGRLRGVVDRYTYAACIGWALVAGGAVVIGWRASGDGRSSRMRVALVAGVLAVCLTWSVIGWRQAAVWHDGVTLWTRAVSVVPDSPVARANFGTALAAQGNFAAAAAQYREALRELPTWAGVLQNLGRALAADGRPAEAVEPFRRLVEVSPNFAEGHLDLGTTLYNLGAIDQAVAAFTRAVELDPRSLRAHENLGTALWRLGRKDEAATQFKQAAALGAAGRPEPTLVVPQPGAAGPGGS